MWLQESYVLYPVYKVTLHNEDTLLSLVCAGKSSVIKGQTKVVILQQKYYDTSLMLMLNSEIIIWSLQYVFLCKC